MDMPPVRHLLANLIEAHQDALVARLCDLFAQAPDLAVLRDFDSVETYGATLGTALQLQRCNIAHHEDRRLFDYASKRAQERFRQHVPLTQLLRLAGALRHFLIELITTDARDKDDTDHAAAVTRAMIELVESQASELSTVLIEAYQTSRDEQWQTSETKYFSLFENASEAIVSFRPGSGEIIEANAQAERLMGRPRAEIFGHLLPDFFTEECSEQARWLISQDGGSTNLRLEEMTLRRADGGSVPVSVSCNWLQVDGQSIAQAILRDVTFMRQMQRELQSYTDSLEARVAERTRELAESEERARDLFAQEKRRARHLSLINDAQRSALSSRAAEAFLHGVTDAILRHFRPADVALLLRRDERDDLLHAGRSVSDSAADEWIVVSEAGGNGLVGPPGSALPAWWNGLGEAAREYRVVRHCPPPGGTPLERPPGIHRDACSEMVAPVTLDERITGLIWVRSEGYNAFDEHDGEALETVAAIIAASLGNGRMFEELRELAEFNQTLISTMLHSLMVVDHEGRIKIVNDRLCNTLHKNREDLLGRPLDAVFGADAVAAHHLCEHIDKATREGVAEEVPEVAVRTPESNLIFDLRISRVNFRGEAQAVILLINLTLRWRKTYQLQLMNEMGRLFQASLDINQVLFSVLTCITAGTALGFNRAFLLLRDGDRDPDSEVLRGAMALGPSSPDEAGQIWREMSYRESSLSDLIAQTPALDLSSPTPLQSRTLGLRLDMSNPCFAPLVRAVHQKRALRVTREELNEASALTNEDENPLALAWRDECLSALELFTTNELAVAPLIAKDRVVGLVLADNLYSGAVVEDSDIQLLDTLAHQAGLTVDNALTYQALQKAQTDLVRQERLVAVGEMAARVSHEIRNPLATIGGFARSTLRRPEDIEGVRRKIGVIVDEVARLEELLNDLLDMARMRPLNLQAQSINALVEHALLLAEADIKGNKVEVVLQLGAVPPILVDRGRLLQALLNTIRNGAQAMSEGGTLTVTTRVGTQVEESGEAVSRLFIEIADTGTGISEQALRRIFDPFFSTKVSGSGLGLPVTRRIIEDHGGNIDIQSQEGEGTTFIFALPLRLENPVPPLNAAE